MNEQEDLAAVEAFCALMNKESEGVHIGVQLLAATLHSRHEKEALQTLAMLDACMKKCGPPFHSEIGKFRFLNEMIKLVSPKYLGTQTPAAVKRKVIETMKKWTIDYGRESKIREAFDMLKKQGVIGDYTRRPTTEAPAPLAVAVSERSSILQDEEKSKLLQTLLQSKNPEDLQAANRLIKSMVKEDDKRAELKSRRISELESVHNNVRLLSEMLGSYRVGVSSGDELDLIKELHQSCERLRPNVFRLAGEMQQNEEMLGEVLQASDELGQVFDKYTSIIVRCQQPTALLDLELASPPSARGETPSTNNCPLNVESNVDVLCDIFSSQSPVISTDVLELTAVLNNRMSAEAAIVEATPDKEEFLLRKNKTKGLADLDVLSESLLKEYLPTSSRIGPQFNKVAEKIPMNQIAKNHQTVESTVASGTRTVDILTNSPVKSLRHESLIDLDLNFLDNKTNDCTANETLPNNADNKLRNGDDCLVDITADKTLIMVQPEKNQEIEEKVVVPNAKIDIIPLTDLTVRLEHIRPSTVVTPLSVMEERNGISVILHFARDRPRNDVTVIVVTTLSKNESPLSNYLFQAVIPKTCKMKLQPPSGTDLPAHNPFLPPSAITQLMLIANPAGVKVFLKFILSYVMNEETITEMGEVEELPVV